jgi:Tfp pilus assembly protein PilF
VAAKELLIEWARYPYMIFVGSYEFRTTLFGVTPWVLAVLLAVRAARRRLDRPDRLLLGFWGIFLLLLEFFPNGFTLDAYYTVPRIFRYLAPISFPVALHAAKLVLDVTRTWRPMRAVLVVVPLLGVQLLGGVDATLPGRIHRDLLFRVVRSIERLAPPAVVAESTLGYWLDSLYLDRAAVETRVVTPPEIYVPAECERWIAASAPTWPTGTVLVTGLGNYVHYGAHAQGLRLAWFDAPLDDRWTLVDDVGVASYLPRPETARLWRLERGATDAPPPRERDDPPPPDALDPAARLTVAIERFNAGDQRVARSHLRVLMNTPGPQTADARFFHAASYFRESAWPQAAHEFKQLLHHDPSGRWAAAAHWHLAICDLRLGHVRRARARFEYLLRRFPADHATTENARAELQRLMRRDGGLVGALWRRFTAPAR